MKKLINVLLIVAFGFAANQALGQKTLIYSNPMYEYQKAMDLFGKEKYNPALESFTGIIASLNDAQSELSINAEYYAAVCAYELYHKDAEYCLTKFISNHPDNSKVKLANFYLGKLQYRLKQYNEAVKTLAKINTDDLNSDELSEYYFKLGYSYFMLKDYENAKKQLYEIKDIDSKYFGPANYYYAHIAYTDKNYETALKSFLKLEGDKDFGTIVPYYIAQIYYLQGNYDEVIKYAPPLLDSANTTRSDEIARIVGESYFKTGKYANSIKYLEKYRSKTKNTITREDYYELGYAYYKSDSNYTSAIENFNKVVTLQDSLAQNSYYLLGDCYLKTGNKKFAMNSFNTAYKLSFYPEIKEDALFNYAKLACELSMNPYNEAIIALQKYIKSYPNSSKLDEANTYLVDLFFTTKNYKDALTSIEKIKNRSSKLNAAYQKIAYFRGIELYNNKDLDGAIEMFAKSNSQPVDNAIKAQCYYWTGEGYYKLSQFDSARTWYNDFLDLPGAYSLDMYNTAHYNVAYCWFKQKNYKTANKEFRKFIAGKTNESAKVVTDAYLRTGDCYFISADYASALEYYDKAIATKALDPDYAIFQKALCLGAQGKYEQKATTLNTLLDDYPKTAYNDDALFELASTYLLEKENDKALMYFNKVITDYPTRSYAQKAMLKVGWIYYNTDKNQDALTAFKKVVAKYPATDASKEALVSIRNIYVETDSVSNFYAYVKTLPFEYGSKTEEDSTTYMAAETQYMNGTCDRAIRGFKTYISQFPDGYFLANAYFYKAECDYKNDSIQQALKGYIYVANQPQNKFSEYAILKTAEICYKLNQYDSAARYYSELENNAEYKSNVLDARTMIMRCYWKSGKNAKAMAAARALISTEKATNEELTEAYITLGRAGMAVDSIAIAQTAFEFACKLSPASEFGAEAMYNLALIEYKLKNYKKAEAKIDEIIKQVTSYDYWLVNSYILLADVYVGLGNLPQAKATLQSIIDNSDFPQLVTIAHAKLNTIAETEKIEEIKKTQEEIEINLDKNPKDDKLNDNSKSKEDNKNE